MENKKCPFCGEEIKADAVKCKHCNEWLDGSKNPHARKYSGKISTTKFVLLSIATFNFYLLIWGYDQLVLLKNKKDKHISPLLRTFFAGLTTGFLAKDIKELLEENKLTVTFKPWVIGVWFFVLAAAYKLPEPYWIMGTFSFVPFLPLLDAMNRYYEKTEEGLLENTIGVGQMILICLGLGLFLCALASLGVPSSQY